MPKKLFARRFVPSLNGKQVECIIAVTSMAEFCRITGWPAKRAKDFTSLPGYNNPDEAVALANPGKIFWRPMYDWKREAELQEVTADKLRY